MRDTAAAEIEVFVLPWTGDHPTKPGEQQTGILHGRVFVNGEEIPWATGVCFEARGGDFASAQVGVIVSGFKVTPADPHTFALPRPLPLKTVENSSGKLVAGDRRTKVE